MMRGFRILLIVTVAAVFLTGAAWSQSNESDHGRSFGLRAGYGTNPDQFVIGAQAVLGKPLRFIRFAPSVDAGFGDGMKTYLFNADFRLLSFSPPGSTGGLYGGVGASLALLDVTNGSSDTEIGLNLVTGFTLPMGTRNGYNLEVRLGLADMPDFRILFGIMLGGRPQSAPQTSEK